MRCRLLTPARKGIPARKARSIVGAGMQIGDVITQVDAKDVSSLDLLQIVTLLRGDPDSMVVITVQREGLDAPIICKVIRHPVKIP